MHSNDDKDSVLGFQSAFRHMSLDSQVLCWIEVSSPTWVEVDFHG